METTIDLESDRPSLAIGDETVEVSAATLTIEPYCLPAGHSKTEPSTELAEVDLRERLRAARNIAKRQLHQLPPPNVASGFERCKQSRCRAQLLLHDGSEQAGTGSRVGLP